MRESFIFYGSYRKALKALPDEMRLKILDSVLDYALEGTEPNLEGVDLAFFELIRPQIDANNRKFDNGKKAAEYGSLGGRPRKEKPSETPEKPQENPTETPTNPQNNPNKTPNVNDNVNVNENVNVNVNVNEKEVWGENKAKGKTSELPTPLERFLQRWKINSNAIGNYSGGKLSAINWEKLSKKVEQSKRFLQKQKALSFFIEHYAEIMDGAYDDWEKEETGYSPQDYDATGLGDIEYE